MNSALTAVFSPLEEQDDFAWRSYHENSKTERFHRPPPNEFIRQKMDSQQISLEYKGYPKTDLPAPSKITKSLSDILDTRKSMRNAAPVPVTLADLSALLYSAYGENRDNAGTDFPRPFRVIPSGGALYPLELYFHTSKVEELDAGLYHYNPHENCVTLVARGDISHRISAALAQPDIPLQSSIMFFVTALFERSSFKYAERSYRFVLLEAGHLMQNLNLAANGLGLAACPIGGFFDREIDALLHLDGLSQAVIYMAAVGGDADDTG